MKAAKVAHKVAPAPRRRRKKRKVAPAPPTSTALAKVESPAPIQVASAIPTIKETVENLERVRRFVSKCLNADLQTALAKVPSGKQLDQVTRERLEIDWGTIQGIDKPFLKQPGAEKFMFWLNLRPKYHKREIEHPGGHLEMIASVTMYSKKTNEEVFEGPDCSCTTMESNYRFRFSDREPPPPQEEAEKLKVAQLGRWRKKKQWAHGKVVSDKWVWQDRIDNPNIHDERNKVRQMGEKRALVKCIRNLGAISEIFTADPSEWHIPDEDDDPVNDQDFTEGGRQIVTEDGTAPSGRPVGFQHGGSKEAAQAAGAKVAEELKRKMEERKTSAATAEGGGSSKAGAPAPQTDHPSKKGEASQNVAPGSAPTSSASPKKIVTVAWASDGAEVAHVYGDLVPVIVEFIKSSCGGVQLKGKDVYVVPAEYVKDLQGACQKVGIGFQEVSGLPSPPVASRESARGTSRPDAAVPPSETANPGPGRHPGPTAVVSGTVKQVLSGQKSRNKKLEHYQVVIGEPGSGAGKLLYCYNRELWPILDQAKGKQAEVLVTDTILTGFKNLAGREFDSDGLTPIVQNSEGRPKAGSLFR